MHSWRVLILPFLGPEENALYGEYNLKEGWDSKQNMLVAAKMPAVYHCPADEHEAPENENDTSYLVYVGKQSAFPGTTTVSRNQITDDQRQTVYVFEAKASSVGWTQPNDLEEGRSSLDPGVDVGSEHSHGMNVLLSTGEVRFLREEFGTRSCGPCPRSTAVRAKCCRSFSGLPKNGFVGHNGMCVGSACPCTAFSIRPSLFRTCFMPLVSVKDLRIGYRGPPLLDGVSCQIEPGERIGLLGRNGSGKTTFMRILSGQVQPDGGQVTFMPGTKFSLLPQDVPQDIAGSVSEVVAAGLPHLTGDHETAWKAEQRWSGCWRRWNCRGMPLASRCRPE